MNLKNMVSEKSRHRRLQIMRFHLYDVLEKAKQYHFANDQSAKQIGGHQELEMKTNCKRSQGKFPRQRKCYDCGGGYTLNAFVKAHQIAHLKFTNF